MFRVVSAAKTPSIQEMRKTVIAIKHTKNNEPWNKNKTESNRNQANTGVLLKHVSSKGHITVKMSRNSHIKCKTIVSKQTVQINKEIYVEGTKSKNAQWEDVVATSIIRLWINVKFKSLSKVYKF